MYLIMYEFLELQIILIFTSLSDTKCSNVWSAIIITVPNTAGVHGYVIYTSVSVIYT